MALYDEQIYDDAHTVVNTDGSNACVKWVRKCNI